MKIKDILIILILAPTIFILQDKTLKLIKKTTNSVAEKIKIDGEKDKEKYDLIEITITGIYAISLIIIAAKISKFL